MRTACWRPCGWPNNSPGPGLSPAPGIKVCFRSTVRKLPGKWRKFWPPPPAATPVRAASCSNPVFRGNPARLFVETGLAAAGRVLVGGPEPRGIGRQNLVNQNQLTVEQAKLELGVRDDDAALPGVGAGFSVNPQTRRAPVPARSAPTRRAASATKCFRHGRFPPWWPGVKMGAGSSLDSCNPAGSLMPQTVCDC